MGGTATPVQLVDLGSGRPTLRATFASQGPTRRAPFREGCLQDEASGPRSAVSEGPLGGRSRIDPSGLRASVASERTFLIRGKGDAFGGWSASGTLSYFTFARSLRRAREA
jgi:hypothetical protein